MKTQYKMFRILAQMLIAVHILNSAACSEHARSSRSITILNWNLQTFFDAEFDGNEYAEFTSKKSGWSREAYMERLERLATVIKASNADILVFEELEKEAQLYDIANMLSGTFSFSKLYRYACFATEKGSAIGCGVLSRLPIEAVSAHYLDFQDGKHRQPPLRPILELSVPNQEKTLTIFVNHWKSKSGGTSETDIWRNKQERQLSRLMLKAERAGNCVLACGDFNRDISEFEFFLDEETNILFHGKENIAVFSPWFDENTISADVGSYWYKDKWERIDHIFVCGGARIKSFTPMNNGAWADTNGHPRKYKIWNKSGYSDHLPLLCTVILRQ